MLYYVGPFTKTRQPPNGHPKPDGFRFGCQITPTGVGLDVKFNPTITFYRSDFWSIQHKPDPLLSLVQRIALGQDELWLYVRTTTHRLGFRRL
jgi:hypothetical protein